MELIILDECRSTLPNLASKISKISETVLEFLTKSRTWEQFLKQSDFKDLVWLLASCLELLRRSSTSALNQKYSDSLPEN